MPIPNIPTAMKVSLVGSRDTREWVNTFHVHKTNGLPVTAVDMGTIATNVANWYNVNQKIVYPPAILLNVIQIRKLDPLDPQALDYTTGLPIGGSTAGTLEAANVTLSVSKRTGLAGRAFRGRYYIAGVLESFTTADDRATSVLTAALLAGGQQLITIINTSGPYELCLIHNKITLQPTPITGFVVEAILDSQRRRLPGRGR